MKKITKESELIIKSDLNKQMIISELSKIGDEYKDKNIMVRDSIFTVLSRIEGFINHNLLN